MYIDHVNQVRHLERHWGAEGEDCFGYNVVLSPLNASPHVRVNALAWYSPVSLGGSVGVCAAKAIGQ